MSSSTGVSGMAAAAELFHSDGQPAWFEEAPDPDVTVVIIGWRSAPYLLDCLRHVSRPAHGELRSDRLPQRADR